MKRSKFLSILLAALMVMSCFSCLSVTSFAAPGDFVDKGSTPETEDADPADQVTAWEVIEAADGTYILYIYDDAGKPAWAKYSNNISQVIFPNGSKATEIPGKAFYGYEKLKTVDLSGGHDLDIIGAYAFANAQLITEIELPKGVRSIGDYAFGGCQNLNTVVLSASLETVGKNVFKGCEKLTNLTVPLGVKTIGDGMFEDCAALPKAELPNSVESIGEHAFEGCTALESAIIPDDCTNVGSYAFYESGITSAFIGHKVSTVGEYIFGRCPNLKTVEFQSNVDVIGEWMFYNCSALETIVDFPENIKVIGAHAFEGCSAIKEIAIPNTVVEIGDNAFYGATALNKVTLNSALTKIGANAFNGTAVTAINIPYAVTFIGEGAFAGCTALADINVDNTNITFASADGVLYDAALTELLVCPAGKSGAVIIPAPVAKIGANAFLNCKLVSEITIPATVTEIAANAFNGCADTLSFNVECNTYAEEFVKLHQYSNTVKHTGTTDWVETKSASCGVAGEKQQVCSVCGFVYAIDSIDALEHLYIEKERVDATHSSNGYVKSECQHCGDVKTVTLPMGTHTYDNGVIETPATCGAEGVIRYTCTGTNCGVSYTDTIPVLAHEYDDGVIQEYPSVKGDGEILYTCTRENCDESVAGHTYTDVIKTNAFDGIKYTNEGAYVDENGYQNLTWWITDTDDLYIYADGTAEEDYSWENYRHSIVNAYVVGKTTTVTNGSFAEMAKLKTVSLATNLTTIEEYAFQQCPELESVFICSVETINDYAFYNCDKLTSVQVEGGFKTVGKNIFKSCDNLATVYLDNGTVTIGYGMFEDCVKLQYSVLETDPLDPSKIIYSEPFTLPDSISEIGELAFDDCHALKEITISDSVGTVGRYAFHNCTSATKLYIGHNAEEIGEYAFSDCIALKDVTIACAMRKMNEGLFMGCSALETIDIEESVEIIGKNAFKDCANLTAIELPVTLKEIGDTAFAGTGLTDITVPAEVTAIGKGAFTNCAALPAIAVDMYNDNFYSVDGILYDMSLKTLVVCPAGKSGDVKVKDGTTTIGGDAFIGCTSISVVEVPESVASIANNAFNGCADTLKIKGKCGSYAINYANERNIKSEVTDHGASVWVEIKAPTCTQTGTSQLQYSCCNTAVPNVETVEIKALGHDWDAGVVTTKAGCETDGLMTYTCTRCNEPDTEVIPATGHAWNSAVITKEATCTEDGNSRVSCANCSKYTDTPIKALGHDEVVTVVKEATCTQAGEEVITCTRCDYTKTNPIDAKGHDYVVASVKDATCTTKGEITKVCSACGDSIKEEIKLADHQLYSTPVTQAPTCTKDGITGNKCAICGQFIGATTTIPATGHKFNENGTCDACGAVDTSAKPPVKPGQTVVTPVNPGNGSGSTSAKLTTPKLLLIKNEVKGISITWKAVDGATGYRVYRRGAGAKSWTYLGTVSGTSYVDTKAATGSFWRYTVKAANASTMSGYENGLYIKRVDAPHMTSIVNSATGVQINWTAVSNAKAYRVYRRGAGQSWKLIATVTKGTSYIDTTATTGNYWRYTVRAVDGYYSWFESGLVTKYVAAPKMIGAVNVKNGVEASWNAVKGADQYRVYRRAAGQSWVYVTTVTGTSYVDTSVNNNNGDYYRYTVRAVDGGRYSGFESGKLVKIS